MTSGWTGGQYAVLRALVALAAVGTVVQPDVGALPRLLAAVLAVPLALGAHDRAAAGALAALLVLTAPPLGPVGVAAMLAPLLLHASVPPAPYGSWAARGRDDPGGGWRMPARVAVLAWAAVVAWHASRAAGAFGAGGDGGLPALGLLVAPLAVGARTRPVAWTLAVALASANADRVLLPSLLALHGFAFDPAWIRGSTRITPAVVFYDGACGLCHRAVRFLLAEDRRAVFRLAPLGGAAFAARVPAAGAATLPDSLVLWTADGRTLVRSEAVHEIGAALGGLWRAGAALGRLVPAPAADRAYDFVASIRHRLFARPAAACPLVPASLEARFLDEPPEAGRQAEPSARR